MQHCVPTYNVQVYQANAKLCILVILYKMCNNRNRGGKLITSTDSGETVLQSASYTYQTLKVENNP